MKKTKTKCYLYTRVSTSMQVDGYSLDAQRDKLRKYAEYEDMVVAGEYSDEGFSGKNIQGRHEFQRMLQDIQDCKDGVEYVLVFKLSRFGRNAADVLNSLQLMQDFGVNLICVEDGIDSSKDSGKLMISVLSAVAEIERENIRTQTMAGREQKAREGKWNGGFAPYGYRLEKGELLIAEDEVDVIRTIFDRYIHTNDGVSGVAKYLNRQGFVKKLRQNGTIPGFSASFVKSIIDNPVYMGKIAYGRRRTEKKIGTRNEMHVVEQSEFPVYEGKHEAIISEEDWNLAQEKRKINAYRREKVNDPTHAHILSGILKCPCCGKSLYGNIAKAHSKDKKTRYYYYCKNTVTPTGHECTFRLNIEQMEMNRMVASIISAMVSDPRFADAIKAKIGSAVDTNDLEKQLEALQAQLRQTLGTKARLERQMDGLDVNDPYYDRKISDLQRRYDEQYGAIDEIEVQIDDVQSQIRSIRQEKISGDNIYRLLLAFDQVYEAASEVERKEFMRAFIERIELFPEKQPDGNWIRKIIFNFPVPVNGTEVKELPLENETIVEENGFLGLVSYDEYNDDLLIASKSTIEGPSAGWLKDMIYEKVTPENIENMKRFAKDNNVTFVFECVDMKHDPHIIEYPESNLYLLDIVYNQINYAKYDYDAMCDTAHRFGLTPKKKACELATWQEFYDWYYDILEDDYEYNGRVIEGFVIEDSAGYMTKLKLAYYNFWKFMRTISYEAIRNGYIKKTSALTTPLANEYYAWVRKLHDTEDPANVPRDICTLRRWFYNDMKQAEGDSLI